MRNIFNPKFPSEEQIFFGLLLTFVGGFFDSYSYINSNGVFANAQTGNLIFVGIEIANKEYFKALNYVPPILFFIIGVIFNEFVMNKVKQLPIRRYINLSLLIQIVVLIFVYFIPYIANIDMRPLIISFVCAMQYDSFRTINNIPFASIFCTGNLRSASEHVFKYLVLKKKSSKSKIYIYISLIVMFFLGVIIGGIISNTIGHNALLMVIAILLFNLIVSIFYNRKYY